MSGRQQPYFGQLLIKGLTVGKSQSFRLDQLLGSEDIWAYASRLEVRHTAYAIDGSHPDVAKIKAASKMLICKLEIGPSQILLPILGETGRLREASSLVSSDGCLGSSPRLTVSLPLDDNTDISTSELVLQALMLEISLI